jgi:hypothetical protein
MKTKLFKYLLLFSLFGIALGFFGELYEGVVLIPKMLEASAKRMLLWKNYYEVISPIVYYIPLTPLATITVLILYFKTPTQKTELKKQLKLATIFQIASLTLTFYIVKQVNLQLCFSDLEKYANEIPSKAFLVNILSVFRLMLAAMALAFAFRAYIQNLENKNLTT